MTIEEIEAAVLKLDPSERAKLAERLLRSLEDLSDAENQRLWGEEALRRHEELKAGSGVSRPANDVLHDARGRLS
jgi:hypothetical protein